ncbi:MAG: HAD-IIB family hydrolase [Deltaproteobacteria bacterium]|nr:HAD-IIB family hydrolase [Deltaproteobacteria bacterium]
MPQLIIITDLDGTLLDTRDYSCEACLPVIRRLKSRNIPLILCSSKTRAEIIPLWRDLSLFAPFIAENGALICFPPHYFPGAIWGVTHERDFDVLELGTPITRLRRVLDQAARACHVTIASFGTMDVTEISGLTGLTLEQAALSKEREYDEPFLLTEGDHGQFLKLLRDKGFKIARGEWFFHITGNHNKGTAVELLLDLYRQIDSMIISVGLGNSTNDLEFLSQVDRPFLVRNVDGSYNPEVTRKISAIQCTQEVGPDGWREAVEKILKEMEP